MHALDWLQVTTNSVVCLTCINSPLTLCGHSIYMHAVRMCLTSRVTQGSSKLSLHVGIDRGENRYVYKLSFSRPKVGSHAGMFFDSDLTITTVTVEISLSFFS